MNALAHLSALMLAVPAAAPDGTTPADGAPRGGLVVEAAGQCPAREAVLAALRPVLGDEALRLTQGVSRVSDLGDRFEIVALGQTRLYHDPGRDCAERARVAAVFITLAVKPPMFAMPEVAGPPPAPRIVAPPPPPPPPAAPVPSIWARLGAGARVDGGPGAEAAALTTGGELRGAIGRGALGAVVTAGILVPTESRLSSVVVHEQRFPCSVGVIGRRVLSHVEGAVSAGLALVPFTLRADGLATSQPGTRLDAGARLAFELRLLQFQWLAPFAEVHAEYFPRAYAIDVDPLGNIGSTGRLWLGAALGVSFDARR